MKIICYHGLNSLPDASWQLADTFEQGAGSIIAAFRSGLNGKWGKRKMLPLRVL